MKQCEEITHNALSVASRGRDPALKLLNNAREVPLQEWTLELCEAMQEICEVLDNDSSDKPYTTALRKQMEVIRHPELTSSARMLAAMRNRKLSVTDLVLQKSHEYMRLFQKTPLDAAVKRSFDLQVEASLTQQQRLNTTREIPFDKYLNNYFSQDAAGSEIYSRDQSQNIPMVETTAR